MVGVNLPHRRRCDCDWRRQHGCRHRRCRDRNAYGRSNRRRRQSSLLRRPPSRWQRGVLRHRASRRRCERGFLRNGANSRRWNRLRLRVARTRIGLSCRGRRGVGLASHKRLPDCVEPLTVRDSRISLGRLGSARSSRDRGRIDGSWTCCRRLRRHLQPWLWLADGLLRRRGFSALHLRRSRGRSRRRCSGWRSSRFLGGKQRLERCRGVRVDGGAGLFELLDVATDKHAPRAGIHTLVEQRNDSAAQVLAGRLGSKVGAVERISAGDPDRYRQKRSDQLHGGDDPRRP